ncbi:MAG TPA: hypothetical protein VFM48_13110 [Aquabacterium sp.]|nr:hypothetical protein [Aquabacterium sp.]
MNRCTRRAWARIGVCGALGLLATFAHAGGAGTNLLVEWRVVSSGSGQTQGVGVRAGGIQLSTQDVSQRQDSVHSLMVLNGGRARLYVGQSVPQTNWQFIFSAPGAAGVNPSASTTGGQQASAGAQLLSQTTWIDLGQGLSVRPQWPGGRAPVKIDIEAQSRQPAGPAVAPDGMAADGVIQRQDVATTLSMPMGQWVVVAQTRSNYMQSVRGTWSTRDVDDQGGQQLELRVSAP